MTPLDDTVTSSHNPKTATPSASPLDSKNTNLVQSILTIANNQLHHTVCYDDMFEHKKATVQLSLTNQLQNDPYGDDMPIKADNHLRIYYQNMNGLLFDQSGGEIHNVSREMENSSIDILCLSEHNLATDKPFVKSIFHQTFRQYFPHFKFEAATSNANYANTYKPGGTMIISQSKTVSRIRQSGSDPLGRWCYFELTGTNNKTVTIVSTYQVVQQSIATAGPSTCYAQQYSQLRQLNRPDPDPRKHFIKDLEIFLTSLKNAQQEFIVGGDFNEVLNHRTNPLSKLCSKLNLLEVYSHMHKDQEFATYARGSKRLDHIFVSPGIASSIQMMGYEPFNFRFYSDHRGMFMDVDENILFGSIAPGLTPLSNRDILSKHAASITRYIDARYSYYQDNQVFKKMAELCQRSAFDRESLEKLDKNLIRGAMHGGKMCAKLRQAPWFVELHQIRRRLNYTKRLISCYRTHKSPSQLHLVIQTQDADFTIPPDYPSALTLRKELISKIKDLELAATVRREEELNERIQRARLIPASGTKVAKIIKQIKRAEKVKQMYSKIRYLRNKNNRDGISQLQVPLHEGIDPKHCSEWRVIDTPADVVDTLLKRNQSHFGQAQGTPFTVPPLIDQFQFDGCTRTAELCLQGEYYTHEDLDQVTQDLIRHFHASTTLDSVPDTIDSKEFLDKLKAWDETTSTSPSGLHLGHYHALFKPHSICPILKPEAYAALESKRAAIIQLHVDMINYCLVHSYSLERWRSIVNVMILKEPGNTKIHRLRVIHIYEADLNLLMGIKWRSVLHHAEDHGLLNPGQYGSRPHRSAIEPVFLEELECEISRVSRLPNLRFDNDATSCYDRILCSLANCISRKYGIHKNVCLLEAHTLRHAKYRLKTLLGVSEEYYSHSKLQPIYGTGQGSTCSPTIWALISSTLFDVHQQSAHGATYAGPDGRLSVSFSMVGFVDDSSCHTNLSSSECGDSTQISDLLHKMTHDAQLWSRVLWSSGGALELTKCSFHLQAYGFTAFGSPSLLLDSSDSISLLDNKSKTQRIPQINAANSHKTLGCMKSPIGNQYAQKLDLIRKSNSFATMLCKSHLSRDEARLFYFSIYIPSITFVLPTSYFSKNILDSVQQPAVRIILSRSGYNCNMAREIVFGPSHVGGTGFYHLHTHQSFQQVQLFLKYWRTPDSQCGKMLRIAFSWTQLQAGIGVSIFQNTRTSLPHLEAKWITSIRNFLSTARATIRLDQSYILPRQRYRDRYIMDIVLESHLFRPVAIRAINYCRLYLRVTTLSDMAIKSGEHVHPDFYHGELTEHTPFPSNVDYPRQHRPSQRAWQHWRRAFSLWSSPTLELHEPLGHWIVPPTDRRMRSPTQPLQSFPSNSPPATAPTYSHFDEALFGLPTWERQLLEDVHCFYLPFDLTSRLQSSKAVYGSDGSVLHGHGTFAWVLSTQDETKLAQCPGVVSGTDLHSYRAELFGLLSAIRFHIQVHKFCLLHVPSATFYTDSESSIKKLKTFRSQPPHLRIGRPLIPEWDVLMTILDSLSQLPSYDLIYVPGHQDKKQSYSSLSLAARLNVDADRLATAHHLQSSPRPLSPMFPYTAAQLEFESYGSITRKYKRQILDRIHLEPFNKKLCSTFDWDPSVLSQLDRQALRIAIARFPHQHQHAVKLVNNLLPTNHWVHRYTPAVSSQCPHCPHCEETFYHILHCPEQSEWLLMTLPNALLTAFPAPSIDPYLIVVLVWGIDHWRQKLPLLPSDVIPQYRDLVRSQNLIGWTNMFRGHLSIHWSLCQQRFKDVHERDCPDVTPKPTSGSAFAADLLHLIWKEWFTIWERRNNFVHKTDKSNQSNRQCQEVYGTLRALYAHRSAVLSRDRSLFHDHLDDHLQLPIHTIKRWIDTHRPTIKASIRQAEQLSLKNVPTITTYFHPL